MTFIFEEEGWFETHVALQPVTLSFHGLVGRYKVFELVPVNDGLADIGGDRVEAAGANDVDALGLRGRNSI